jgi:Holliday junction resolvasome RuvABC endonuclease subunit
MKRIPAFTRMICVEDIFMPRQAARIGQAMNLAKLAGVIRLAILEGGFPFYVVNDMQLKKFACGRGQGIQKGIIIREAYKKWGIDAKDDNQADAAVLAYMAEGLLFPASRG